jgi:hypothetical protein
MPAKKTILSTLGSGGPPNKEGVEEYKYNPYTIDWRFLPEEALVAKDYLRHYIVSTGNSAARSKSLSAIWLATLGRRTVNAIKAAGILFIHIPKTSGTSISACIYGRNLPHYTADFYSHVFGDSIAAFPSFSIIRHPVERLVSAYKMAIFGGTNIVVYDRYDRSQLRGLESLDSFVDFLFDHRTSLPALPNALHEQASFIQDGNGSIMVDRLFPLDSRRGLPSELSTWLGIDHIPHLNATKRCDIDVSDRNYGKIIEIYARDFEIYNNLIKTDSTAADETTFSGLEANASLAPLIRSSRL